MAAAMSSVTPRIKQILQELKRTVTAKYSLSDMRLFGSNVRREATKNSDIDIFLQIPNLTRAIEEDVYNMAYALELKYDCLIDVILLSDTVINTHSAHLPIYQNILQEGGACMTPEVVLRGNDSWH